jgi:oleate hydratase
MSVRILEAYTRVFVDADDLDSTTFDLFSFIPSAIDRKVSVKQDTELAEQDAVWHNKARLIDRDRKIINFHELGFSERDRIDMVALMARTEHLLDSKRIS